MRDAGRQPTRRRAGRFPSAVRGSGSRAVPPAAGAPGCERCLCRWPDRRLGPRTPRRARASRERGPRRLTRRLGARARRRRTPVCSRSLSSTADPTTSTGAESPAGGSLSPPIVAGADSLRAGVGGVWGRVSFRSSAPMKVPISLVLLPKSPSPLEREVERTSTRVCACTSSPMRITTSLARRERRPRVRAWMTPSSSSHQRACQRGSSPRTRSSTASHT